MYTIAQHLQMYCEKLQMEHAERFLDDGGHNAPNKK
jgi:hypothetical protein